MLLEISPDKRFPTQTDERERKEILSESILDCLGRRIHASCSAFVSFALVEGGMVAGVLAALDAPAVR